MATPSFNEATHEDGRGIDKLFHWLSYEKICFFSRAKEMGYGGGSQTKMLSLPSLSLPRHSDRGNGKRARPSRTEARK